MNIKKFLGGLFMSTDTKIKNQLNSQREEVRMLRTRMSALSDQVKLLENEVKGLKENASRDISTLLERVNILRDRLPRQR
jgi:archaellum component FlaC